MRTWRAFVGCQSGAAAAELALLVPLLVLMMFGGIEVSYYLYNEHQVVKGVRDGARYASRQGFDKMDCATSKVVPTTVEGEIKEVARTGQISGGTPRVPGWVATNVTVSVTCKSKTAVTPNLSGVYRNQTSAPVVTVTASVNYISLFKGVGIITDTYKLNATQQAAVMGI